MSEPTKEQINRRLVGIDDRFHCDHVVSDTVDGIDRCDCGWNELLDIYQNWLPDYCSSDSPRSLLEGIEAQLSEDQWVAYVEQFNYRIDALKAIGEEKAKAIYAVLDVCNHQWVDARNKVVMNGEVCLKCGEIRAENAILEKE